MMGAADNQHENSLWHAPLEEVTQRVIDVMRRMRPQVVITFNDFGAYGHPDHIKINQATIAAFQQLQSEPEHPQKLYYTTGPQRLLRAGIIVMKLLRRDPRKAGKNNDMDFQAAVDAMNTITTRVSIVGYQACSWQPRSATPARFNSPTGATSWAAPSAASSFAPLPSPASSPEPQPHAPIERDLFANLPVELPAHANSQEKWSNDPHLSHSARRRH